MQKFLFIFKTLILFLLFSFSFTEIAFAYCPTTCTSSTCQTPACNACGFCASSGLSTFFGIITQPPGIEKYGNFQTGLMVFANNLVKLIIVAGAVFAFFNIIIAGYTFLGAGGDAKKVEQAWGRIWQSLLGLVFVAGAFVLAAIFGYIIFGDPSAILSPKIYGPTNP